MKEVLCVHILFAGGGTGGHINPALAVAGYIRKRRPDAKISFIGNATGMEAKLVPEAGYDFYGITVAGFQRKISLTNIKRNIGAFYHMFTSSAEAARLLKQLKPDIVMGTGGYVSGPVLRKAAKLGIHTAIQEQNAFPGVTTKVLSQMVDRLMRAMPEAEKCLKPKKPVIVTGNPIRDEILKADKAKSRKELGLDERPMILSFGGSLGAKRLNETIADVMQWHCRDAKFYHFHATGKFGIEWMPGLLEQKGVILKDNPQIHVQEYINNMDVLMSAADLVICRAGAITLSELQALGKASILIPSPNVAENHQYHNAMALANRGAAAVFEEKDLDSAAVIKKISEILGNKEILKKMENASFSGAILDSNEKIYKVLTDLYHSVG